MTVAVPTADTTLPYRQSLAHGRLGIALLDIERARRGTGTWAEVHHNVSGIGPLIDGPEAGLFLGAPAMAFVLHCAAEESDRYATALQYLDTTVAAHARQRVADAHARIDAGRLADFSEYDLFRGLTGIGALLLRRRPHGPETKAVLDYLVRLTEPLGVHGGNVVGWWVGHTPTLRKADLPCGHANSGLAHGIAGPLALLALAMRAGVTVDGQEAAIRRICRWLDSIRRYDHKGVHWPRWVTEHGPAATPSFFDGPSWCYGTPGLARAQQLAAVVTGDADRKRMAERALLHCVADTDRLGLLDNRGLCHGLGGVLRTVQRVAEDAERPAQFTASASLIARRFLSAEAPTESGFLEGAAGAALAFQDADPADATAPRGQWDACLLLT
jgi:hypothetical protein